MCEDDRQHEAHRERDEQIEAWWNEGLTLKQIAAKLGWSFGHVKVEIHRVRQRGYSLPYRRQPAEPAFPELRKAA